MQIQIQIEKCKSLKRLESHMEWTQLDSTRVESTASVASETISVEQVFRHHHHHHPTLTPILLQSSTYCLGNANIPHTRIQQCEKVHLETSHE